MFRERKNRTHKSLAKIKLVRNTLNGTCSMFVFKLSFFATSKLFQKWYAKYQFMFALYSCCWVWICVCAENEIQFLRPISEFNWLNSVFGLTYNSSPDHNLYHKYFLNQCCFMQMRLKLKKKVDNLFCK